MSGTQIDFSIPVTRIDGTDATLEEHRGKVLLVVNTASECGFTPQYGGLETLYRAHKDAGLVVLGFPCNQFGKQEPGTEDEIASFCRRRHDVTFPMYAKVDVNGRNAHPLFTALKSAARGVLGSKAIKWNFTKFLVDREGHVVTRFGPRDTPNAIEREVAACL